jgi:hypothetical protein
MSIVVWKVLRRLHKPLVLYVVLCFGRSLPGARWVLLFQYCQPVTISLRRQIDSPRAPRASMPSVRGSREGAARDSVGSSTVVFSGPLVFPAVIGLFATVS